MNIYTADELEDSQSAGEGNTSAVPGDQDDVLLATNMNEASSTLGRVAVTGTTVNTAQQRGTLQFLLDWKEYRKIMPLSESEGRLSSEWTEVMYRHFHRQYASCPLAFTGNRLRKKESRKKRTRFWVGRSCCKVPNCIRVVFQIREEPVARQSVTVDVTIAGSCTHTKTMEDNHGIDCDDSNSETSHAEKKGL